MAWVIELTVSALGELRGIRQYERRVILDCIQEQLTTEPAVPSRNRKCLVGVAPAFDHVPPVWELRVGEYRVFYDLDVASAVVTVRAVRHKRPGSTTEEIVQ